MPYITPIQRQRLDPLLQPLLASPLVPGDLNYLITRLLLHQRPSSYETFNALIGVLECVKQELYRRAVAPYEDIKIKENGDVYLK